MAPAHVRLTDGMAHLANETTSAEDILELLEHRPPWHADAQCREHPEANFFPALGESGEPAKAVCTGCLVRSRCLEWALGQGIHLHGIWGGASQRERRRLLAHGTAVTVGRIARRWEPDHGTITRYRHHGCRCPACKAAKAEERARAG